MENKQCEYCKKTFTPTNRNQKFCSTSNCKTYHHNERRRLEREEYKEELEQKRNNKNEEKKETPENQITEFGRMFEDYKKDPEAYMAKQGL